MESVDLTVLQVNGRWTVKLQDERGVQYLGETDSRGAIEAFAGRLIADLTAAQRRPRLTVRTTPERRRDVAKSRPRAASPGFGAAAD
jgi:hypothetical protein